MRGSIVTGIAERVKQEYADLTYRIIGAAMTVHTKLGPGFPEVFYQRALAIEMGRQGLEFERERPVEVFYDGVKLGDFHLDSLVDNRVVAELKAVDQLAPQHLQQGISYLTSTGREVTLLINFGAVSLEHKCLLPPLAVQKSAAYQARRRAWQEQAKLSARSADELA
ncbi:MAG: GxxExxY protein [Chloroflexi bacterium]|nr:GxxExxY protein [Chloroflexota bacterium]MBU1751645.1 GxxExxY protein [Chloroflexota bacterium]MBU1878940.1 GxxExxY protein [Chloroflexota bacterium]